MKGKEKINQILTELKETHNLQINATLDKAAFLEILGKILINKFGFGSKYTLYNYYFLLKTTGKVVEETTDTKKKVVKIVNLDPVQ